MAGDKYRIADQNGIYFTTSTIVDWIDVFTRISYKEIIVQSLNYCVEMKGLEIYAWVLMSNHLHMVCRAREGYKLSEILRDFKKFTSKQIIEEIKKSNESRAEWFLDKFSFEARKTGRAENYKVWQDANHAIEISGYIHVEGKIEYIHLNPVRAGWVNEEADYVYSSARDYADGKGLVKVTVL
jgi:REP element-mobilizing transposase RayT